MYCYFQCLTVSNLKSLNDVRPKITVLIVIIILSMINPSRCCHFPDRFLLPNLMYRFANLSTVATKSSA